MRTVVKHGGTTRSNGFCVANAFFRSDFDLNCMGNFPFVWGIIDLYWMSFSFSEKWIETNLPYRDVMHVVDREKHTEEKIWLFVGETSLFHLKRDQKPSNWKLEWWTSINFVGEKGRLGQEVNRKKRGLHIQEAVKVVRWKQLIRINLGTLVFEISFYNPVKSRIWYNFPLTEVYTKRYSHYCSFTKTTNSRVLLWSREEALFQNHQRSPWQKFCNMSGWRI